MITRPKYQSSECNHVHTAPSNTQQDIKSRYPQTHICKHILHTDNTYLEQFFDISRSN